MARPERDIAEQFESMIGPLSDDPTALDSTILVLTKALVDAIDPAPIKTWLKTTPKGEQGLQLLRRFTDQLGDETDCTEVLRSLQTFRSAGGVAHLAGSRRRLCECRNSARLLANIGETARPVQVLGSCGLDSYRVLAAEGEGADLRPTDGCDHRSIVCP